MGGSLLLLGSMFAACSIEPPDLPVTDDEEPATTDTTQTVQKPPPRRNDTDAGSSVDIDAGRMPTFQEPVGGCVDGATRPCGPEAVAGTCKPGTRTCHDGIWGECEGAVMPTERDCSSPLDNDCDGKPDNAVDDICVCVADTKEACDTHGEFDGKGKCVAGERTCQLSADRRSTDWGACSGAVGPVPEDSCTQHGDDSNCNGRANDNCTCVEGDTQACGPPRVVGICKAGTQTCVNSKYGDCIGAVYSKGRDCTSPLDNDCDGKPDNTVDDVCKCKVGETQACGTHPDFDGVGICKAGTQTCVAGANNKSSAFNACTGSVGPAARNCTSTLDNDCDGVADNTIDTICKCAIGAVAACDTHPGDGKGICKAGQALCIAGANNSSSSLGACSGAVGPLPADSCTVVGDDSNCDGVVNGGCECVVSTSCADPTKARCSAGKCVACTANADCTHLGGLGVCSAGACVECTAASAAACSATEVCDPATNTCVAAPPPPPPPAAEVPVE